MVKLYGEHAVVYGKLAVAAAISMHATVSVHDSDNNKLMIKLTDFEDYKEEFDQNRLRQIYEKYKNRTNPSDYVSDSNDIDPRILPYATIAARLANEFNLNVLGREIEITSKVPMQTGLASSAVCSTAFTIALLKSSDVKLDDKTIIDVARDGERVAHKSEGAGRIDVTASYYGGYVSTAEGGKKEPLQTQFHIVIIDTGPKKSTAETVGNVRKLYERDKENTENKLNEIENCTKEGLKALSKGDLVTAGAYMYRDQELLKELGVSSEGLDKAVSLAKANGAYGAKLSGGGGGGVAFAMCDDPDKLIKVMAENGFKAYKANLELRGARDYLN